MTTVKILATFLLVVAINSALTYDKVILQDRTALCLDGSPGAYYIHAGDPKKVMFFMEGGAWCGDVSTSATLENCYKRSKTALGSSTSYPAHVSWSSGALSDDGDNYFNGWTRIFMKYCDGSGHQGSRSQPILYKGAELYFRGQNITLATFEEINKKYGIVNGSVTHLVLSGGSAGGLAAFHWTNYVQSKIKNTTKFWSIPDSGIFMDVVRYGTQQPTFRIWFENILKFSNQQTPTPIPECDKQNPNQLWRCMFVQYFYQHIKAPVFAINSLYDTYGLAVVQGINCLAGNSISGCDDAHRKVIQDYHQQTFNTVMQITGNNQNGAWSPACLNHCYFDRKQYSSPDYRIPQNSDYSLIAAVTDWMEGKTVNPKHIDFGQWPVNRPCSGFKTMSITTA